MQTSDIKKNTKLLIDDSPFTVVDFQHVKPGKGNAFTRMKVKNLKTGAVLEKTYKSGEKLEEADVEYREMQYLYKEGDMYTFMDSETYDQISLEEKLIDDIKSFLKENLIVTVLNFNSKPINIELPTFVELEIEYCEPGFKGDTATGGNKPATLAGGHVLNVPLYLKQGDVLKIDTRTGEYVEKINK